MNFKDLFKRNYYNTLSIIIYSIHTIFFARDEERRERNGKILKEKQSQEISCFHERLFHAKILLEYSTKSIKIQFIKKSFKI